MAIMASVEDMHQYNKPYLKIGVHPVLDSRLDSIGTGLWDGTHRKPEDPSCP